MSFLAVLLLEEARHWSHLTATSEELFCLNYSSYMTVISFKETDISLLPPWCQIKSRTEKQWLDLHDICLEAGNVGSPGTARPKNHIIVHICSNDYWDSTSAIFWHIISYRLVHIYDLNFHIVLFYYRLPVKGLSVNKISHAPLSRLQGTLQK